MKSRQQKSDRELVVEHYRCQKCGKEFTTREDLLLHEEIHDMERVPDPTN